MVAPESLLALPAPDFRRTRSVPLQSPRELSLHHASSKSQPAPAHQLIAPLSPPPARFARALARDFQRSKPCRIVGRALRLPINNIRQGRRGDRLAYQFFTAFASIFVAEVPLPKARR